MLLVLKFRTYSSNIGHMCDPILLVTITLCANVDGVLPKPHTLFALSVNKHIRTAHLVT